MRYFRPRPGLAAWLFLSLGTAFLASRVALATVPVTDYVVIQPIDVCNTSGPTGPTGCAPFNILSQSPDPSKATSSTPIGFVDPTTNVNITRAIWLQTGIDVTFLPFVASNGAVAEYNNTTYQSISDVTCANLPGCSSLTSATSLTSTLFKQLSSGSAPKATGCKSNCTVPLASTKYNAINMFFVNNISAMPPAGGAFFGFAWLNGNGVAIAANVFSPSAPRFDTLAHELGHNLNLDHTTFGAGTTCPNTPQPQGCNVMDAGTMRVVPTSSGCSSTTSTTTGGVLFDLDTGLCGASTPGVPQADQMILGNSTNVQQGQALLSGFLNPIANVPATATAGGGVAAATIVTTTTTTATASTSDLISFTVTYPRFAKAGGRSADEYIFALVFALPSGFQFGPNPFTLTATNGPQVFSIEQLNGNNGQGNTNCLKPLNGAPSIQCLEIDFDPGTFTTNTSVSFTLDIINKTTGQLAMLNDLACTPPASLHCLDLTYVFSDLLATSSAFAVRDNTGNLTANPQLPDEGVISTIVDPANFPSVANLNPPLTFNGFTQTSCTLTGTSKSCPPPKGGNPGVGNGTTPID